MLERGRVAQARRDRWDSFCLVTPNWAVRLPGGCYEGADRDGFIARDEVVGFLERYRAAIQAPVREGLGVRSVERDHAGRFVLRTSAGEVAESVAWGDERHRELVDLFRVTAARHGLEPPDVPEPEPFDPAAPEQLDLAGFGAVIFAGGFRPD